MDHDVFMIVVSLLVHRNSIDEFYLKKFEEGG
jgi:hypothetical protein